MSSSLLRGLRVIEMLGQEPIGVSEIARRLGVDKAGVSRVRSSLVAEGWVTRTGSRFVLAERALALGGGVPASTLHRAAADVRRVGERTGRSVVVLRLTGTLAQPLAQWQGVDLDDDVLERELPFDHLGVTAGGLVLLAQTSDELARAALEKVPWESLTGAGPTDSDDAWAWVERVRAGEAVVEESWTVPGLACIARPWRADELDSPCAIAVLGPSGTIDASSDPRPN